MLTQEQRTTNYVRRWLDDPAFKAAVLQPNPQRITHGVTMQLDCTGLTPKQVAHLTDTADACRKKNKRNATIRELRDRDYDLKAIGRIFNLSEARIEAILAEPAD